jgi:hypothetical protein
VSSLSPQGFDVRAAGWFLHDIDPGLDRASFVRTDRASLSAEPFLDHRWRADVDAMSPLAGLEAPGRETPRLNFIWHTSFCASTLLSACLDFPGRCLALKEPRVLVLLADMKRRGLLGPDRAVAKTVFGLLARRFQDDEQVLVKPSNAANALASDAADLTHGRAILLYSDCESFLLSMAKQGDAGFSFARNLFRTLAADGHPAAHWPAEHLLQLTDLQLAALVWRMQMDLLEVASTRLGDRARSLDCRQFLDAPGAVLREADDFLGLGLGPERLEAVVTGPLFERDAKRPGEAYDRRGRADAEARLRAHLGDALPMVLESTKAAFPRAPRLAPPLLRSVPSCSEAGDRIRPPAA